jgi:hypothetical protein
MTGGMLVFWLGNRKCVKYGNLVMSVTLTAFGGTALAGAAGSARDVAERVLLQQQFVMTLQNSAASGMPQLANPAAMASRMSEYLRGYVERSQSLEKATKDLMHTTTREEGAVVRTASVSSCAALPGGPARERLDPSGADGSGLSSANRASLEDGLKVLDRLYGLFEAEAKLSVEETLLTNGTQSVVTSLNNLLTSP